MLPQLLIFSFYSNILALGKYIYAIIIVIVIIIIEPAC
jgi:hypothetical protein